MKGALIAVGREVLTGKTLDTNSHWLAGELTALGIRVKRICVVDDDVEEISGEVGYVLKLNMDLVITTGGLGPTRDDLTLQAWSKALGRELALNTGALDMVRNRYVELYEKGHVQIPEITPEREKMAWIPDGSNPLFNSVGAAPGVFIGSDEKLLFALPGVPAEMKSIFKQEVVPLIKRELERRREGWVMLEELVRSGFNDESFLWPLVKRVMDEKEDVYLKTLATSFGAHVDLLVRVEAWGETEEKARERLKETVSYLRRLLQEAKGAGD
jgi:molybdenum cofactor synthesis domain-containing protein